MSVHSNQLRMIIAIKNGDGYFEHFEAMNDYICFNRSKVKDYTWSHEFNDEDSTLTIEFFDVQDAMLFKLTHG